MTPKVYCILWHRFHFDSFLGTWVIDINNILSFKTILFDILVFRCQLEEIRFVKTLSKRRMFVSFIKISASWLPHCLLKFNKICWEKRPAKPQPNLRTSFWRRDLKKTQPHLKCSYGDLNAVTLISRLCGSLLPLKDGAPKQKEFVAPKPWFVRQKVLGANIHQTHGLLERNIANR